MNKKLFFSAKTLHALAIIFLVLIFIGLRWNSFNAPLIRDEGEYAYAAQLLIHSIAPYAHAFIQKPPMVIYSYALAHLLLPNVFWSARLLAYLFAALATILLGYAARLEFGKGIAWSAMGLMTPMILLPALEQFYANTEMFLLLPLFATVAIYIHSRHHGQKFKYWFAAGFLGITTLCYKYTALPLIVFIFFIWSVELGRQTRDVKLFFKNWLAAIIGGIIALALELGFFWIHDHGASLWQCTVLFNRYYAASTNFNFSGFWSILGNFWHHWWFLFLIPLAGFLQNNRRAWIWAGMLFCAILSTDASVYSHYYILLMPFWAVLCAVGIHALANLIGQWRRREISEISGLLTFIIIFLIICADLPWLVCSPKQFAETRLGGYPFIGALSVAKQVDELSSPNDFVFVAGSEPEILFYAQRFSPTRFITVYALMIPTPSARSFQREAIDDLKKNPPKLIIFTTRIDSWLQQPETPPDFNEFLKQFMEKNYVLVGGHVFIFPDSHWLEPISNRDIANADLLLYERKSAP